MMRKTVITTMPLVATAVRLQGWGASRGGWGDDSSATSSGGWGKSSGGGGGGGGWGASKPASGGWGSSSGGSSGGGASSGGWGAASSSSGGGGGGWGSSSSSAPTGGGASSGWGAATPPSGGGAAKPSWGSGDGGWGGAPTGAARGRGGGGFGGGRGGRGGARGGFSRAEEGNGGNVWGSAPAVDAEAWGTAPPSFNPPVRRVDPLTLTAVEVQIDGIKKLVGQRVQISGLSDDTTWHTLKDHLRQVGEVSFCKIFPGGRAMVEFTTPEEAARGITELQGSELEGATMFLREDREDTVLINTRRKIREARDAQLRARKAEEEAKHRQQALEQGDSDADPVAPPAAAAAPQ